MSSSCSVIFAFTCRCMPELLLLNLREVHLDRPSLADSIEIHRPFVLNFRSAMGSPTFYGVA